MKAGLDFQYHTLRFYRHLFPHNSWKDEFDEDGNWASPPKGYQVPIAPEIQTDPGPMVIRQSPVPGGGEYVDISGRFMKAAETEVRTERKEEPTDD